MADDLDVVLLAVVGSTAYGLAREGSDVDRLGVFVAPTSEVLGLRGHRATDRSLVTHEPDVTLHELGKFCTLALKGNPTVLEALFADDYEALSPAGRRLVEIRSAFLSTPAVRSAYGRYALAQAQRLASRSAAGKDGFGTVPGNRTAKHGRHCLRLLLQGEQLLSTGSLTLDVSTHRDELFAAGTLAATDPEAFADLFSERMARFDTTPSVLPGHPDTEAVESIVVAVRLDGLASR